MKCEHSLTVGDPPRLLAARTTIARTPLQRLIGLLGHASLSIDEAMVFPRCRSIHTWGMRFTIDVIAFDREWRVLCTWSGLAPGRLLPAQPGGWGIVELAAGALDQRLVRAGERLRLSDA